MSQLSAYQSFKLEVASDEAKGQFLRHMLAGMGPREAARMAGCEVFELYLARCADPDFSDLWHLAELARRDEIIHSTLSKAMAVTGTVIEDWVRDDRGEIVLDADFNAVRAPRLVGGNSAILSKMLERVLASADKPAPGAVVQITNNQSVGGDVLPPMPRLINPMEDFDG